MQAKYIKNEAKTPKVMKGMNKEANRVLQHFSKSFPSQRCVCRFAFTGKIESGLCKTFISRLLDFH
jgi:hypothetical protein